MCPESPGLLSPTGEAAGAPSCSLPRGERQGKDHPPTLAPRPPNESLHPLPGDISLPAPQSGRSPCARSCESGYRYARHVTPAARESSSPRGTAPRCTHPHPPPAPSLRGPLKVSGRYPAAIRAPALGGSSGGRDGGGGGGGRGAVRAVNARGRAGRG